MARPRARILTIDQATRSGWAFGTDNEDERFLFGRWQMPRHRSPAEKLLWLLLAIRTKITELNPTEIVYEAPFLPRDADQVSHWNTIQWGQKIECAVMIAGAEVGIDPVAVVSQSWRATFLGFGRAPKGYSRSDATRFLKRAALNRARQLGYEVTDENEAEAIGILYHALFGAMAVDRNHEDLFDRAASVI